MSYGLMALSVNWTEMTHFFSNLGNLRAHAAAFADDARDRAEEIAAGAPSLEDAMRAIYTQTVPARSPHAAIYVYALKGLAKSSGSYLPNSAFYPCPLTEIAAFDEAMCAAGMPPSLRLHDALYATPPLGLPRTDGLPLLGRLPLAVLQPVAWSRALASLPRLSGHHGAMQKDLERWVETVTKYSDDLVLFYH